MCHFIAFRLITSVSMFDHVALLPCILISFTPFSVHLFAFVTVFPSPTHICAIIDLSILTFTSRAWSDTPRAYIICCLFTIYRYRIAGILQAVSYCWRRYVWLLLFVYLCCVGIFCVFVAAFCAFCLIFFDVFIFRGTTSRRRGFLHLRTGRRSGDGKIGLLLEAVVKSALCPLIYLMVIWWPQCCASARACCRALTSTHLRPVACLLFVVTFLCILLLILCVISYILQSSAFDTSFTFLLILLLKYILTIVVVVIVASSVGLMIPLLPRAFFSRPQWSHLCLFISFLISLSLRLLHLRLSVALILLASLSRRYHSLHRAFTFILSVFLDDCVILLTVRYLLRLIAARCLYAPFICHCLDMLRYVLSRSVFDIRAMPYLYLSLHCWHLLLHFPPLLHTFIFVTMVILHFCDLLVTSCRYLCTSPLPLYAFTSHWSCFHICYFVLYVFCTYISRYSATPLSTSAAVKYLDAFLCISFLLRIHFGLSWLICTRRTRSFCYVIADTGYSVRISFHHRLISATFRDRRALRPHVYSLQSWPCSVASAGLTLCLVWLILSVCPRLLICALMNKDKWTIRHDRWAMGWNVTWYIASYGDVIVPLRYLDTDIVPEVTDGDCCHICSCVFAPFLPFSTHCLHLWCSVCASFITLFSHWYVCSMMASGSLILYHSSTFCHNLSCVGTSSFALFLFLHSFWYVSSLACHRPRLAHFGHCGCSALSRPSIPALSAYSAGSEAVWPSYLPHSVTVTVTSCVVASHI